MRITEPTILLPGSDVDIGMTARLNRNGFVAVDIGMACDAEIFTPEKIAGEKAGLPGWRFRKEYLREWSAQAGQPVFEAEWLDRQKPNLCEPILRLDLDETGKKLIENKSGRVLVWVLPTHQPVALPAHLEKVTHSFGAGSDVGEGVDQSDSTIEVFLADGREQAAEFRSNTISPVDLGRMAAALCRYYNNALFCPVRPMHGITVIRTVADECGYSYIWRDTNKYGLYEKQSKNLGWAKGEASSPALFGGFRDDIQYGFCKIHSLALFNQLDQYIYDEFGFITMSSLAHLSLAARKAHGDLVIGAALARRACLDLPKFLKEKPIETALEGSYNYRRKQYEQSLTPKSKW